jgi:tetratricopeptide (TPR) repeat protein
MVTERPDTTPGAERNFEAHSNDRVYQAAGNQYIYNRPSPPVTAGPCNTLPRDTPAFTGRDRELRTLIDGVQYCTDAGTILPVYAIQGMPGVGKSALAVHAGHLLEERFPDGQFFLDLHAHTAGPHRPVQPGDALFDLLSATGLRPAQIPEDIDARAALWRSRMAGNKALLILDNAVGRWQVQPLLPGANGCLVIVTSRRRLIGLGAHQAAVTLAVDTLPQDDATALFATMANRRLNDADVSAVHDLVRLSGYLPLAICLLAARLRPEPRWRVGYLADELGETKHRLAHMRAEDLAVAAAFDLSYRLLPPGRRRFFRRLGLHPGAELDCYVAAALDGITPAKARQHLEALYHDHLLDQLAPGRYRMHDLISEYAGTRAESDPVPDREAAIARMLDYYQCAARAADQHLSRPAGRRSPPSDRAGGGTPALPALRTRQQALAWMSVEQANLFACVTVMSAPQWHDRLTALVATIATYLRLAGPWDRATCFHIDAAAAAGQAGDRRAQACALHELGVLRRLTGQYVLAERALCQAIDLHEQIGHRAGVADALTQLAGVLWRAGDQPGAADRLDRALTIYQALGDLRGQADALHELGGVRLLTADYRGAAETLRQALAIHQGLGDLHGTANALIQLGAAQQLIGEDLPAIEAQERALILYRQLGDRQGEARALNYLGITHCQAGDHAAARAALVLALTIHRDLGYRPGQANALNYLGVVYLHTGDYPAAEQALTQALTIYQDLGHRQGEADSLNQLGVLARMTGDCGAAARMHEQALALFRQVSDHLGQAEALNNLGELLLARDEPAKALDHYRLAQDAAERVHNAREEAHALEGLSRCALRLGRSALST